VGVTGQQRMLTLPRHLNLPLVFPGVRVSLVFTVDYSMYLIKALILTVDFSVYLAGLSDFDCGLFHSSNLDALNLSTDI
jgi:ABC-type proline/glycine betaine transport system permease subunit